uniref:Protein max n=1 Tax=Rattus norvegicus TaxID=10116 RepID=A0A8I5ZQ08_RAT
MSDNDDLKVESDADKQAHHNALERKCRDHIKDSFHSLRDSVPSLQGEKASRAQILDKATEYIQYMRRKNHTHQQDLDDLKRQNALWSNKFVHWRRQDQVPNCKTTTPPQTTASTSTPRAAPSLPSMGVQTPAQSPSLSSPRTGRNYGWSQLSHAGQASSPIATSFSSSLEPSEPLRRLFSFSLY